MCAHATQWNTTHRNPPHGNTAHRIAPHGTIVEAPHGAPHGAPQLRKISKHYLVTWFLRDFVSSIPLDLIMKLMADNDATARGGSTAAAARTTKTFKAPFQFPSHILLYEFAILG